MKCTQVFDLVESYKETFTHKGVSIARSSYEQILFEVLISLFLAKKSILGTEDVLTNLLLRIFDFKCQLNYMKFISVYYLTYN